MLAAMLLQLILGTMSVPKAQACSCFSEGPFGAVFSNAELVATVRVESYGPGRERCEGSPQAFEAYDYMVARVLEVLSGVENATKLRIYGDTGHLCRPYITAAEFGLGEEYVVAINRTTRMNESGYAISVCGEYWVPVRDGYVTSGARDSEPRRLSYDTLRALVASGPR